LTVRSSIRLITLSSLLVIATFVAACSSGGDSDEGQEEQSVTPAEPIPTIVTVQPTPEPPPVVRTPTASPATPSPVIVATPRSSSSTYNDPDRDHSISGFIVDAVDGRTLRGVTVRDAETGAYGISNEFGFYRIDGLAPGHHALNVTGHRVKPVIAEVETESWTRLDLSVSVIGDASSRHVYDVVGRVTNRDSGAPIAGATVTATEINGVTSVASVTTDDFGAYGLTAIPRGTYALAVDATDYPSHTEQVEVTADLAWEVFLRATPSTVKGRVTGETPNGARPPFGSSVRAISLDGSGIADRSVAATGIGLDGAYTLGGLQPGNYRVEAIAPGYQSSIAVIELSGGRETELDFDLELDGASLRIALTSSTYGGIGVGNIAVRVQGVNGTPAEGIALDAVTGLDGSASIGGLPSGMYDVWTPAPTLISGGDNANLYPVRKTLQLGPGESRTLNADLPAVSGDIHGYIRSGDVAGQTRLGTSRRDAATSPVNDVHESFSYLPVQLSSAQVSITAARFGILPFSPPTASVTSDQFGNFVFPLPPGTYSLEFEADGHVTAEAEVTIRSAPVTHDVRLPRAATAVVGRIDGPVIEDLTNETKAAFAVAGTSVVLQHEDQVYSTETDERGVFAIENLPLTVVDGAIVATEYELRVTNPDYLPLAETLSLEAAEGAFRLVRQLPTLAAGGFMDVTMSAVDKNGDNTIIVGTLESVQNLRTMDVYDASFLVNSETIEVPNRFFVRARPGRYLARICPDTPGGQGCFDHFWTSTGGEVDVLDLSFNCGDTPRLVSCSLDGGINAGPAGHIQATGYVYSASSGEPLTDARVTVSLDVLATYCDATCIDITREFSATGPTGPNGRYSIEFTVPTSNGGADLVRWSWGGDDQTISVTSPGYQTLVETGIGETLRNFNGTQDYYLAPSGRLNLLVVGTSEEGSPVSGFNHDLGITFVDQGPRAAVTLSPLGAELATGSDGSVSFNSPPGTTTVRVSAPGHYPYDSNVAVPDANGDGAVIVEFTLPIEQIPPPSIQADSLRITGVADGRPMMGYVLRGISSSATAVLWEVDVDRNGVRLVRDAFDDPVELVDLVIHASESCPGAGDAEPSSKTLHLRGHLLSGSSNGAGTWGGEFDVADLPCGSLSWRVEARTSRSLATLGFDWEIWPSEQRYPLSLLTGLAGSIATPEVDAVASSAGSVMTFNARSGSLQIKHDGEYLKYKIPDIAITSDFEPSSAGKLIEDLSGFEDPLASVEAALSTAILDGKTGLFNLQPSAADSGPYTIAASALFSLDSAVAPAPADTGRWVESISTMLRETRPRSLGPSYLPGPLRSVFERLDISRIDGTQIEVVAADATWDLALPPEPGIAPPITGERKVVTGTRFEIVSVTEFEFATSVMSHLNIDGHLGSRSVTTFAEIGGDGSLREESTVAFGSAGTSDQLWAAWRSTRNTDGFTFFDRDAGTESVARSSIVENDPAWLGEPATALESPGPAQAPDVVGVGGVSRPSISAGVSEDGEFLISSVSIPSGGNSPRAADIVILESGETGSSSWSAPLPLADQPNGLVIDTAITFTSNGDAMLVWSAIPDVGDDPREFIHRAAGTNLFYSHLDAGGGWSRPEALTNDNRPDLAPVIASDGEGRTVLAWARDMDGNVLTVDDIVVYASEWIAGSWTTPTPIMAAPSAVSELSVSVKSGTAVVGIVADARGTGREINLSFNSLGKWSPVNVIAGGRPGLKDVAVLMDRPGLATIAWAEQIAGDDSSRIVSVEATSAGVRGETIVVDAVAGFLKLMLVPTPGSRHLAWVADGGSTLYGSRHGQDDWSPPSSIALTSGRSSRFVAVPGDGDDTVLTIHEIESDGVPGLTAVPLSIR